MNFSRARISQTYSVLSCSLLTELRGLAAGLAAPLQIQPAKILSDALLFKQREQTVRLHLTCVPLFDESVTNSACNPRTKSSPSNPKQALVI